MAASPMDFPIWEDLGAGSYIDNSGRLYPQLYYGTPGFAASAGYTNDLGALLTGPSAAGSIGRGWVKGNVATVGTENGVGFGTPGVGVTYGIGPFEFSKDYSQPWIRGLIADSADRAGVPSRNNVWEYDDLEPNDVTSASTGTVPQKEVRRLTRKDAANSGDVLASGSSPTPNRPSPDFADRFGNWTTPRGGRRSSQASRPVGVFAGEQSHSVSLPSWEYGDRREAKDAPRNATGGLLGMIQDYMRNNVY